MRELHLRAEHPKIRLNGRVFSLLLSDLDLYLRARALFAEYERIAREPKVEEALLAAAQQTTALLETALGPDAVPYLSGGHPVGLPLAMEWLGELAREAAEHYTELALSDEGDCNADE
ncbi:MAG: hypothetical protein PHY64_01465 [Eubacteriales bacterium]|nr:hypothetical protein [Eubacteriales bacterium]